MKPALSVIVVNFNAGDALRRCLSSLEADLSAFDWEAVVVDNCSTDGSDRIVEEFVPRVGLVRNPENLGFARAVNGGMAATRAPNVLLINPDAHLTTGAVERLLTTLEQESRCAVVGPAVLNEDMSLQGSARGDPDMLTGLFGRSTLLTRLFPGSPAAQRNVVAVTDLRACAEGVEVDWISGACMLLRRDAFLLVGGFDDRFFLYWEDADLCRRQRNAGFSVRYQPAARVVHLGGRSSSTASALAIRAFHRSAYRYYSIHVRPSPRDPVRWLAFILLRLRGAWFSVSRRAPGR
jgi:GT2 family glycosyltransferase